MISGDLLGKALIQVTNPILGAEPAPVEALFAAYRDDFVGFCEDVLGVKLYEKQAAIAQDMVAHPRVCVGGANGVGKTFFAACAVLWWLNTRANSAVVTTAGTWHQVQNLLWREIHDVFRASRTPLPGRMLDIAIEMTADKGRWYAVGLRSDDPDRFLGHHAEGGVLAIVDEANRVEDATLKAMDTYGTTAGSRTLMISNMITRQGRFARVMLGEEPIEWRTHTITAYDSPHVSKEWIDAQAALYSNGGTKDPATDPVFQVTVLARFPDFDESGLFPMSLLEMCADAVPDVLGRKMGVDIAAGGADKCVAVLMVDGRVAAVHSWAREIHRDTMRTVAIIKGLAEKWRVDGPDIGIDVIGVGAGVVDRLRELGIEVEGVNFGAQPARDWDGVVGKHKQFMNRRAELYWVVRCLMESGQLGIGRKYREIWTDLLAITYTYQKGTLKLVITPKEEIKKMLGRSPDFADAVALALSKTGRRWISAGRV